MSDTIKGFLITQNGIEDQSIEPVESPAVQASFTTLVPLFSSQGKDGEFVRFSNPNDYLQEFGDVRDIKQYGQSGANGLQALSGGSDVIAYRLMPTNATRAALMLAVKTKVKTAIPQFQRNPDGSFKLDPVTGNKLPIMIDDPLNPGTPIPEVKDGIEANFVLTKITDVDNLDFTPANVTGGYTLVPLIALWHNAHGECGGNYGFTIELDNVSDRLAIDGRRYVLSLYKQDSSGVTKNIQEIYFALNPKAVIPGTTSLEAINYVYPAKINGLDNPVKMKYSYDNYLSLTTMLATVNGIGSAVDYDIFAGFVNQVGAPYDLIVEGPDSIDAANTVSNLQGGSDGSLKVGALIPDPAHSGQTLTVTAAMVAATKKSLLIDFFNCDLNPDIFNPTIVDAKIVYDANFPFEVKAALIGGLPKYRPDIVVLADGGIIKSASQALQVYPSVAAMVNAKVGYQVAITMLAGLNIPTGAQEPQEVTYTYDLARRIPENFLSFKKFCSPAGFNPGRVKYMVPYWYGRADKSNTLQKLRDNGIWFVEKIADRYVQRIEDTQYLLSDEVSSKLKSFRNALIVTDALQEGTKILDKYPYDPAGASDSIKRATAELNDYYRTRYPESTCTVTVNIYQTKRDAQIDNATCVVTFSFFGLLKTFGIKIVAKRG